jgi:PII-like signaling protein
MRIDGDAQLLRIFIGESDRWEGRPLYEAIVRAAREYGLAGATALRGIEGFGASNRIHTVKILRLSEDLPIVVEVVDRPERIAGFLPVLDKMISEGMVTVEKVRTFVYRHDAVAPQATDDDIPLDTSDFEPSAADGREPIVMTSQAQHIVAEAKEAAASSHRVFVDSVDVLLTMLCDVRGIAGKALGNLGIDCGLVERSLRELVSRDEPSAAYLSALESKSAAEAKWLDHGAVGTEHMLLALCQIRPSAATDMLTRLGAQPREICREVLEILDHREDWQRWIADHPDM